VNLPPTLRCRRALVFSLFALGLALGLAPVAARAEPTAKPKYEPTKFEQLKRDPAGNPLALQVATARYVPAQADKAKQDLYVDLVGVIHVGDQRFYERLNASFKNYDVVLFEMVIGQPSDKALLKAMSKVLNYNSLAETLKLASQGKHINYKQANFLHADASWQQLEAIATKKGDDLPALFKKELAGGGGLVDPLLAVQVTTFFMGPVKMKATVAEAILMKTKKTGTFKKLEEYVIDVRNEVCLRALQQQIAAGKKKIAIFYGSAHMPHFERHLIEDFGLRRENLVWHNAWDLTPKAATPPAMPKTTK
jgi:hypothetical protein